MELLSMDFDTQNTAFIIIISYPSIDNVEYSWRKLLQPSILLNNFTKTK